MEDINHNMHISSKPLNNNKRKFIDLEEVRSAKKIKSPAEKYEALKSKTDFKILKFDLDDFKSHHGLQETKLSDSSIVQDDQEDDTQIMEDTKLEPSEKPSESKPLFFTFVNETLEEEEPEKEDFSSSETETVTLSGEINTSAVVNSEAISVEKTETKLAKPAETKPPKTADTKLEPKPLLFTFVNETLEEEEPEEEDFSSNDSEAVTLEDESDTFVVANNLEIVKESSNKENKSSRDPKIESSIGQNLDTKPSANLKENDSSLLEIDDDDMEAAIITKPEIKLSKSPLVNDDDADEIHIIDIVKPESPKKAISQETSDKMDADGTHIIDIVQLESPKKAISQETSDKMDAVIEYVIANYKQEDEIVPMEATCKHCKQSEHTLMKTKTLENAVSESVAIRDESISLISFESCVEAGWPPCFRVTSISIYDESGHMVPYNVGLIEAGVKVFFSGLLLNLVDDDRKIPVDRVGPILSWRRPDWAGNDQTAKLILTTMVDSVEVEYHVPIDAVSPEYVKAMDYYKPAVGGSKSNAAKRSIAPSEIAAVIILPNGGVSKKSIPSSYTSPLPEPQTGQLKDLKNISKLLATLDGFKGIGKRISHLIPGYEVSADAVAAFLLFIYERHVIWRNRRDPKYKKGNLPLTNNKTLATKWFTNMYREVDRGTTYFRSNILKTVLKNHKGLTAGVINLELLTKILYKSIVYRLMNKLETFEAFGNIPDISEWPKFSAYISQKMGKEKIFTAAHQTMGLRRFLETMNWVNQNIESVAIKVAAQAGERSLKGCFKVIHSINNVGPFFAWQILCDLLENRLLGKCTDNQWTVLGPGAKNGLRMIFDDFGNRGELGMTRMLRNLCIADGPNSGFEALGKRFPALLNQNLSLKNVEHALCEFSKYYKLALGLTGKERQYNMGTSRVAQDKALRCCVCEENSKTKKKFLCVLCNRCFHLSCLEQTKWSPCSESFLCDQCQVNVDLWKKEDFDFDEVDSNDGPGKEFNFVYAKKKAAKVPKKKDIECIDLSSDEEEDENSLVVEELANFGIEDCSEDKANNAESPDYSSAVEDESKDALDDSLEVVFINC